MSYGEYRYTVGNIPERVAFAVCFLGSFIGSVVRFGEIIMRIYFISWPWKFCLSLPFLFSQAASSPFVPVGYVGGDAVGSGDTLTNIWIYY